MHYSISLDIDRCTGCYACAVACMDHNTIDCDQDRPYWRWIIPMEEQAQEDRAPLLSYIALACLHCHNAPCAASCPTGALELLENGMVTVNRSACIGCRACLIVCPFGVPRFDDDDKMEKCTLCKDRIMEGLEPACVRTCPTQALTFECREEPVSDVEAAGDGRGLSKPAV